MNRKTVISLVIAGMVTGLAYFAWQQQMIMFMWPYSFTEARTAQHGEHKQIQLFIHNGSQWTHESTEIISGQDQGENAKRAIQALFNALREDKHIDANVTVTSALVDYAGTTLFVSFDRSPLKQQASTFDKLMIIEAILKTLDYNKITTVQSVNFLCNQQNLHDEHLDFKVNWPLQGFGGRR